MDEPSKQRQYKYWITRNCERQQCWLVVAKLGEMLLHKNTTVVGPDGPIDRSQLPLTHDRLEYVYLIHFQNRHLVTLVQDCDYYYLIDNKEIAATGGEGEPESTYESHIMYDPSLSRLVTRISSGLRKKIGLKTIDKIKLKASELSNLKGTVQIDFIGKTHQEQVSLFQNYVTKDREVLDLSGLFLLDPKVIEDAAAAGKGSFPHKQIILYQNNKFHKFGWLKCFPKVSLLSMWYINMLTDDNIPELAAAAPYLNTLEFHCCFQLTGRALIPLSGMPLLDKLILNYEKCRLHEAGPETVITDQEWSQINNSSLSLLLIDSLNLTLDFIDFTLKRFTGLTHFIMDEQILEKLKKNSSSGGKDREEPVTFHSVQNTQQGFKRYRDIRVYDLVRNKCGNAFSESMLKKIKERSPEKTEAADLLLGP